MKFRVLFPGTRTVQTTRGTREMTSVRVDARGSHHVLARLWKGQLWHQQPKQENFELFSATDNGCVRHVVYIFRLLRSTRQLSVDPLAYKNRSYAIQWHHKRLSTHKK